MPLSKEKSCLAQEVPELKIMVFTSVLKKRVLALVLYSSQGIYFRLLSEGHGLSSSGEL